MSDAGHIARHFPAFSPLDVAATLVHLAVAWGLFQTGEAPQGANALGWLASVGVRLFGQARTVFRADAVFSAFLMRSGVTYALSAICVGGAMAAGWPFWAALGLVGGTMPVARHLVERSGVGRVDPGDVIAVAVGVLIFVWFREAYVNHDVAWYLVAGRQWIDGARLYTDLSEVNPPLAFYLVRGALHFGDLFGLGPSASLAASIAALTALSLIWVARLTPTDLPRRTAFLSVVAAATTLPFLAHFGQREHLMVILILPWVAAALFRDAPHDGAGAAWRGLAASIGICVKPHFLIYPAALVLFEMVRRRSLVPLFSAGNLAMGAVGVAYVAGVAVFHPEYFTVIVPDARLVYGAYTLPFEYVMANLWPMHITGALLVIAVARTETGLGGTRVFLLILAALGAYAAQRNGFTYHAAPAHALALVALGLVLARSRGVWALAAVGMTSIYLYSLSAEGGYRNPFSTTLAAELEAKGLTPERLLVWSPSLLPAFPLVLETRAEWVGHAVALWLLPGTLDLVEDGGAEDDPRRAVLERSRAQMERDLARCPDVLILDRVLPFREAPLDVLAYAGVETARVVETDYARIQRGPRFDILTREVPCG